MRTDVKEDENGYELHIELPGYQKEDVKAQLKDGYLTIQAEKNQNNGSYNNNNNHKPNGGYSRYSKQYGGRSKIGDKYVDEYTPEEFGKMLKEMQRRKWGTKSAV